MKFISDSPISLKIQKMKERVRWQHPSLTQRGIDRMGTRYTYLYRDRF